jgi:predicted nucleic acid-binding protein
MLFDTEFIIALSRRPGTPKRLAAEAFLVRKKPATMYASVVTFSEISEGFETAAEALAATQAFTLLDVTSELAWRGSRIARELKGTGLHIGDNDVWIATTALAYGLPLVSNNARHLGRVPGLDLRSY